MRAFDEIRVRWNRKSAVGELFPFDVIFVVPPTNIPGIEDEDLITNVPIYRCSPEEYHDIAESLSSFQQGVEMPQIFVATDGIRYLAIDTSGYDYPRYKSPVCVKWGEVDSEIPEVRLDTWVVLPY